MEQQRADVAQWLDALATLGDPVRRALYHHVAGRGDGVSRDEAAEAAGISRSLAAYHLDKLAAAGLLDIRFERRTGRRGPGAGRPAKLYLRARDPIEVTVPARAYQLIAGLLAGAVEADESGVAAAALHRAARAHGLGLGPVPAEDAGSPRTGNTQRGDMPALRKLLAQQGYEPYEEDGVTRLRNCPFGGLASRHRELVCGANLALLEGVIEAQGLGDVRAVLDPRPDECCVSMTPVAS